MHGFAEVAQEGMVQVVVRCENGHDNPENRLFCGDCGTTIVPTMAVCVLGHVNAKDQHFCGDCGVPIRGPGDSGSRSPGGRWNVDPSGAHQYRYWDGDTWTEHIADNGTFGADPFSKAVKWHPETWVGIAAGVATIVLVIGAIIGIAMQLSGGAASPGAASSTSSAASTSAPVDSTSPSSSSVAPAPAPEPGVGQVAVIGTACLPNSSDAKTADGSTAYCARLESTATYMWSLYPGAIPSPFPAGADAGQRGDPAIAVCMAQTNRTALQCVEYLQRPSTPGDGRPAQ